MISFHWRQLLVGLILLGLGLLAGVVWQLPTDQAANVAFLLVGLLVGVIGIVATLWVSAHERERKIDAARDDVAEVKANRTALTELARQMWGPALDALLGRQAPSPKHLDDQVDRRFTQVVEDLTGKVGQILSRPGVHTDTEAERNALEDTTTELKHQVEELRKDARVFLVVSKIVALANVERFMLSLLPREGSTRASYWPMLGFPGAAPFPERLLIEAR